MAIQTTNAIVNVADRIISQLKAELGGMITAVNAADNYGSVANSFTLPGFEDQDIIVGDNPGHPPLAFPCLRLRLLSMDPMPLVGHTQQRGHSTFSLRGYLAAPGHAAAHDEPHILTTLERAAMAMAEIVRACLEKHVTGSSGIYRLIITRIVLPDGTIGEGRNPMLIKTFEIDFRVGALVNYRGP